MIYMLCMMSTWLRKIIISFTLNFLLYQSNLTSIKYRSSFLDKLSSSPCSHLLFSAVVESSFALLDQVQIQLLQSHLLFFSVANPVTRISATVSSSPCFFLILLLFVIAFVAITTMTPHLCTPFLPICFVADLLTITARWFGCLLTPSSMSPPSLHWSQVILPCLQLMASDMFLAVSHRRHRRSKAPTWICYRPLLLRHTLSSTIGEISFCSFSSNQLLLW